MKTADIKIIESLETLCEKNVKQQNKGSSFRPFKYYKSDGEDNVPVFFVGVPGLTVAMVMTALIMSTVYMITLPFNIFLWIGYLLVASFVIRFAMKIDKSKQIRFMCQSLSCHALRLIKKAKEIDDEEEALRYAGQAKALLKRADEWLDDPCIGEQLAQLEPFEEVEPELTFK
ncbi:hypothetical protein [Limisalsivibrio acetivorans]|uniref:hypothetical protein n=1 Tax=Limisalsivibrio acetivorans TaxID=1304888 RepID=UPI0003B458F4|nr:hypothetical protein [Limisalsivibrio acetivorans]